MYIATVPNRGSPPAILLREGYREGGKVKNRTLTNLSKWPPQKIDLLRRLLRDEPLAPAEALCDVVASFHHGHVQAVRTTMQRLGFDALIAARPSRERDVVVAMVAARILEPDSKLATTRWWHTTTLPADLGLSEADEDTLYEAMDWLLERQDRIEQKLAARHLRAGGFVLYDLTSSYFEGTTCPLAAFGHNRDGKKGKLQVNYGLLADARGCPVAVSVFKGNTGDPPTLLPEVRRVRERFGVEQLVVVGDRGMISQTQISALQALAGVDWLTALKTGAIRDLVADGHVQLGLFDERNLFELAHPDFPGERLVACRNPELAKVRAHKRQALLAATVKELDKVCGMVARGTLRGRDAIGVRVGKVINKYKVAKHVKLEIQDERLEFQLDEQRIAAEAALDGIYVIRTSVPAARLDAADAVRHYKRLSDVERAFRSLKTIDLKVRPIHHRLEPRVRAHIFLCLLAYYVEWHMREAWRALLFSDEDQAAKQTRDPVAPAKRSAAALHKVHTKVLDDGTPVHSFSTLLKALSGIVRNLCRPRGGGPTASTFEIVTTPNPIQQRAYDLLKTVRV
jgi:transposase